MKDNNDKKCFICSHLKFKKQTCPIKPFIYSCDIINGLIYSTRLLTLKLEKLNGFYCSSFKRDIKKGKYRNLM